MWKVVFLIATVWAADPIATAIERAQALALKKDRAAAAEVLNQAIEATTPPLKGRARLIESQASIAKMFFTDKGQKLFESGQSAMYENPDIALNQYREAAKLEGDNLLLIDNIARILLAKQDCGGAVQSLEKARTLYPYAAEPAVLELRALVCQKNFEAFREKMKSAPTLEKGQDAFVQYLVAQDLLQQKMWRKASEVLNKVSEDEPQFPETYYWLTRAGQEIGRDTENWAQKYVSLCKGITVRERKRFSLEPRLCTNLKEVEDELAKKAEI